MANVDSANKEVLASRAEYLLATVNMMDGAKEEEGAAHRIITEAQDLVAASKLIRWEDLDECIKGLTRAVEDYDNLYAGRKDLI